MKKIFATIGLGLSLLLASSQAEALLTCQMVGATPSGAKYAGGTPSSSGWTTYFPSCGVGSSYTFYASTPWEFCELYDKVNPGGVNQFHSADTVPLCKVRKHPSTGSWIVDTSKSASSPFHTVDGITAFKDGGDACLNSAWSGMSNGVEYDGPCERCPEGKEWDDETDRCGEPECDEGEIFDDNIAACRPECEGGFFYEYAAEACHPQCMVGTYANVVTNDFAPPEPGSIGYLNGCSIEAHSTCQPDTSGASPTGNVCLTYYKYNELRAEDPELQLVGPGSGYVGEDESFEPALTGTEGNDEIVDGRDTPLVDVQAYYVCDAGQPYAQFIEDGEILPRVPMLGDCANIDQVPEVALSPSGVSAAIAAVSTKVDAVQSTADDTLSTAEEVKEFLAGWEEEDGILRRIERAMSGEGEGGEPGEFEGPGTGAAYEQQHTEGVAGVVGEGDLGETDLGGYLGSLVPSLGADAPECIAVEFPGIPSVGMPGFTFEPYCPFWDIAASIVMALAAFMAWAIVWRV